MVRWWKLTDMEEVQGIVYGLASGDTLGYRPEFTLLPDIISKQIS